jgi:type IX secretion system PorP/SprF family membrane protein
MTVCKLKYLLLSAVAFFSVFVCPAQQQPMFTQYMFNGLVLNPAYAGSHDTFTATAVMRQQWTGIQGAPQTQAFSAHSPLDNLRNRKAAPSHVSLGLTLFHDRIAITGQTGLLGSYAYRLNLLNGATLAFGLQAGFSQLKIRYSELELDDPSFSGGDITQWQPDFGAGVYYKADRFYAGLSAPQMLRAQTDPDHSVLAFAPHYFLTMGYIFDINTAVKVKPNILVKNLKGELFQFDINCNVYMKEILHLGVSWRSFESVGTLVQVQLNPRFAVGYAYDIPFGNELSSMSHGSHEVMLNYSVPLKKIRTINPRFF